MERETRHGNQMKALKIVKNCKVHRTAKLMPFINLYDSEIGADCFIGPFVEIGGSKIGARTKISSHTYIPPLCEIGTDCFIAHGVQFTNDTFTEPKRYANIKELAAQWKPRATVVGNRVRIGSGAVILPVKIGDDVIIGAGTVVTKDVPDGTTVWGTPSRPDPRGSLRG